MKQSGGEKDPFTDNDIIICSLIAALLVSFSLKLLLLPKQKIGVSSLRENTPKQINENMIDEKMKIK